MNTPNLSLQPGFPPPNAANAWNLAKLRALRSPPVVGPVWVNVLGHTTPGDGGSGTFVLDRAAKSESDDDGICIACANGGVWRRVFSGPVDLRWFGAIGDGDDAHAEVNMRAIQRAIDHCAAQPTGGTVLIPPGDFRISPCLRYDPSTGVVEPNGDKYLELKSNVELVGLGMSSLLKVKDDAGDFRAVFTSAAVGNDDEEVLENVRLANFRLDTNAAGNDCHRFDRGYEKFKAHQFCLVLYRFRDIAIDGMRFDYGGTNAVAINNIQKTVDEQIRVSNCHFQFHKLRNAKGFHTDIYDNTAAYLKGRNVIATDNRFVSDAVGGDVRVYAFGALEVYGGTIVASGNSSTNYASCVNVLSDEHWPEGSASPGDGNMDMNNITVTGNLAVNANFAFQINPFPLPDPEHGKTAERYPHAGLANVTIANNVAQICQKRWGRYYWGGIGYNGGLGHVLGLTIVGNSLRFEEDGESREIADPKDPDLPLAEANPPAAIDLRACLSELCVNAVRGIVIGNNCIYNSPCIGIAVGRAAAADVRGLTICGNTIVNAGWYPAVVDKYRAAIRLCGHFRGCTVVGNTIVDTDEKQFRGRYSIWAAGTFDGLRIDANSACVAAPFSRYAEYPEGRPDHTKTG